VAEAEARANAAEDRARETTAAATELRETSAREAESLLNKARREAEQLVGSAKKEADRLRTSGHAEAEAELATIKSEVDRLSKRRDGIVAQLAALKDVVSGFGGDEEPREESDSSE